VDGKTLHVADAITWLRLLMLPVIWWFALRGRSDVVAIGLLLGGSSDMLDGFVARQTGSESLAGATRDLIADTLLLLSAAAWIGLLHPEIVRDNMALLAGSLAIYLTSLVAPWFRFHRLPGLQLYSSKAAGGLLYAFALITLISGRYDRLLLVLAAGVLIVSCVETLAWLLLFSDRGPEIGSVLLVRRRRAETNTIQAIGSARKQRSQAPTANVVASIANPISSMPIDDAPRAKEMRP
jgi:phosphatidylglycerophosphate synthase